MSSDLKVVAIIAAYNEGDLVGQVVTHLIQQGVQIYFLDNGSTDDTLDRVRPFLGTGVLMIEPFVQDSVHFSWQSILARKEALARELDADWLIHQDADEFRES